jgi:hypothetical protein
MENIKTIWLKEAWFKLVYEQDEYRLKFKAYKIEGMDEENISESRIDPEPVITGTVKWDGCIDFHQELDHYCGLYHAKQTYKLFQTLYNLQEEIWK